MRMEAQSIRLETHKINRRARLCWARQHSRMGVRCDRRASPLPAASHGTRDASQRRATLLRRGRFLVLAVTLLVLLARAARTRIVAPDLGAIATHRLRLR